MSVTRPKNLVSFGCLHPIQVTCADGQTRFVPCRQCAYCRVHAADALSQLGTLELLDNPCSLFVTLTYRNCDIPRATLLYDGSICNLVDLETGELYTQQFHTLEERKFLGKISKNYVRRFPSYFCHGQIPFIRVFDIQQYIARMRERFRRKFGKKYTFRYIYCAEYGETTFRPHFHIIFLCKSEEARAFLYENSFECWQYGFVVSKYYRGNNSRYLTSYMSGSACISPLYSRSGVKSRARHSQKFGCSTIKKTSPIFNKFVCGCPLSFSLSCDGSDQSFNLPPCLKASVFPRCRDFGRIDDILCLARYHLAVGFDNRCSSEIARILTDEIFEYNTCPFAAYPKYYMAFGEKLKDIQDPERIYSSVYYDVLVSKKFLQSARLYSHNCHTFHLFKTRQFYGRMELEKLLNQHNDIQKLLDDGAKPQDFLQLESWFVDGGVYLPRISDYRTTRFFYAWKGYCESRLYDLTKYKKIKEKYTLKDYE